MPYLLDSICTIIGIFHKYAQQGPDCSNLNRREMKTLIQTEFAEILENPGDPQILELTFQLLDVNGDSLVDFNEYLVFIFQIAKACYSYLKLRECFPQGEGGRAVDEGQPGRYQRNCGQLQGEERKQDSVQERQDSHLPHIEEIAQGERKGYSLSHGPGVRAQDIQKWDSELRPSNRRIYPSHQHKEWEAEERAQRDTERWQEQQREDTGCGQLKQWESAGEEDYQCKFQDHVQRHGSKRHVAHDFQERVHEGQCSSVVPFRREHERPHRGQETDYQEAENLIRWHEAQADGESCCRPSSQDKIQSAFERCCPFCQQQEWEDGRRDRETQGELKCHDCEQHVADEYQHRMYVGHTPVDDHEEHCSCETGPRESEHRRQQSYSFQHRETEQRPNQARNQEIRESERLLSDLNNTDGSRRHSQSHGHKSRGGVQRSQWAKDEPNSWEETQEIDSGRRRPPSSEPKPRNHEYSQDSERRQPQHQESAQRGDHQGRHQYYETESWDGGRGRRQPPSCYSDPRDSNDRRPHLTDSRDKEQEQLQTKESVTSPTQQQRFSPPGPPEVHEWSRQQESELRPSEQREGWSQRYDLPCCQSKTQVTNVGQRGDQDERTINFCGAETRDVNQRQTHAQAVNHRETGQQRRMSSYRSNERDVDQKWALTHDGDPKVVEQQRTSSPASDAGDIDLRQTQTCEDISRDGEEQRRMSSHDFNSRGIDQRRTPTPMIDPKKNPLTMRMPPRDSSAGDGEQRWVPTQADLKEDGQKLTHLYKAGPRGREPQSRSQAYDHDFRDADQREIQSQDSDSRDLQQQLIPSHISKNGEKYRIKPMDHFQREAGEEGLWTSDQSDLVQLPEALPQQRGSQHLSGPQERGAPRRWLLPCQLKAQEGEARRQQRPAGTLVDGNKATSKPQEQQTTEGHQCTVQHKPATPGKGDLEGSQAGGKDQAQEPAGIPQQQIQSLPSQEGDQPELTEPKKEGGDGRRPSWAREAQSPLEKEEEQEMGLEQPSDLFHEKKASGRCNPLYEYLLSQRKPE